LLDAVLDLRRRGVVGVGGAVDAVDRGGGLGRGLGLHRLRGRSATGLIRSATGMIRSGGRSATGMIRSGGRSATGLARSGRRSGGRLGRSATASRSAALFVALAVLGVAAP